MYKNKMMNEHKLRRSHSSRSGAAKRSTRRKKISSPIMSIIVSSAQYAAFKKQNNPEGGIILNIANAGDIKKRGRGEPFTGKMIVILD